MRPPLPIYHVEMLVTSEDEIPDELRARVVEACAPLRSVRAVHACRIRRESLDGEVSEPIRLAIEAVEPATRHGQEPLPTQDMHALFAALAPGPDESLGFPSGRGLEPWVSRGVCLYRRPTDGG